MKIKAVWEHPQKLSPFNKDAVWLSPQWQGDEICSVEVEVGDLLYSLVKAVKPKTVLETGTWKGFSTRNIVNGLYLNKTGKVTTVDKLDQKFIPYVLSKDGVDKHKDGHSTYEKIIGDVFGVLSNLVKENRQFNIIFCDDLHEEYHVEKELEYFESLVTKPGYILFHDTYPTKHGDVGKVVKEWADKKGYAHIPFYTARGLDIVHVI